MLQRGEDLAQGHPESSGSGVCVPGPSKSAVYPLRVHLSPVCAPVNVYACTHLFTHGPTLCVCGRTNHLVITCLLLLSESPVLIRSALVTESTINWLFQVEGTVPGDSTLSRYVLVSKYGFSTHILNYLEKSEARKYLASIDVSP